LKYIDNLKQYLYKNIKNIFNIKKSPELNPGIFSQCCAPLRKELAERSED
jgi:hypothetical protein